MNNLWYNTYLTEVHVAFHVVKIMHVLIYGSDLHGKNGGCSSEVVDISVFMQVITTSSVAIVAQ